MSLLQASVDSTVIALWLGHADTASTQQYIHADMTIKERALALLTPPTAKPGRYRPTDEVLAYLDSLSDVAHQRATSRPREAHRTQRRRAARDPPSA